MVEVQMRMAIGEDAEGGIGRIKIKDCKVTADIFQRTYCR
jgi:hypothetical protein